MKNLKILEKYSINLGLGKLNYTFLYPISDDKKVFIIATSDYKNWDHVSVHL